MERVDDIRINPDTRDYLINDIKCGDDISNLVLVQKWLNHNWARYSSNRYMEVLSTENWLKWRMVNGKKIMIGLGACAAAMIAGIYLFQPTVPLKANKGGSFVRDYGIFKLTGDSDIETPAMRMQTPSFVPAGYEMVSRDESKYQKMLVYQNGEKTITIEYYRKRESGVNNFRWDPDKSEHILIHGIYDGYYTVDQESGQQVVYWDTGFTQYIIMADPDVGRDDLDKMAYSIMD